jgi:hypothetical protein
LTTIVVQANPPSVSGVSGGTSNITATLLDQNNFPIAGVNVLFRLAQPGGTPQPSVPSISPLTAISDASGQAVTVLIVPAGTPPQFLVVTASSGSVSGQAQIGVTTQRTGPPGPPARLNAALFKFNTFGDNNDGTFTTILSALVTDVNGNPVADGVEVDWGPVSPDVIAVSSPSFTNAPPPCNTDPYERDSGIAITEQPGTALTCLIYPRQLAGASELITVRVAGTTLTTTAPVVLPFPPLPATPIPTPVPPPTAVPTPVPTATPTPVPSPTPTP